MPACNDGRQYFPRDETKNDLHLVVMSQTKNLKDSFHKFQLYALLIMLVKGLQLKPSCCLPVALTARVSDPQVVSVYSPPAALRQTEAVPLHLDSV